MSVDTSIARHARAQHGLVTVQQLRDLGCDRRHLDRRVEGGTLEQLNHQVFRVTSAIATWESRVLAAVLGSTEDARTSHLTAAALWDLDGFRRAGRPDIAIPRGRLPRPVDARVHTSTDLDRCSVVLRSGIPTTDLARTLLDLGRYLGVGRLNRAVEAARRQHDLALNPLLHTLMRHARQGRHGVRRLRTVLTLQADRSVVTDSDFELLVLTFLAERGLPTPHLHHRIMAGDVLIAEVDMAWPDRRVAVELQGQHHRSSPVWELDLVKIVELQALGWTVLPFSWRVYVDHSEWMVRRIREAVAG